MVEAEEPEKEISRKCAAVSQVDTNQCLIAPFFQEQYPIVRSTLLWNKLTNSICYFIAKDMQPYDTVNVKGFQHLLRTFNLTAHHLTE